MTDDLLLAKMREMQEALLEREPPKRRKGKLLVQTLEHLHRLMVEIELERRAAWRRDFWLSRET